MADYGPAYYIYIKIFNKLQNTISGWPGGKPNADGSKLQGRAEPAKKRMLIFSPHPDDEALRFASFVCDYNDKFGIKSPETENIYEKAVSFLKNKKVSEIDIPEVRYIKGLIRKGEAESTSCFIGLIDAQIYFMELPFYETGTIEKNPLGEEDIKITMDLIDKIKPRQIFAAGDLSD